LGEYVGGAAHRNVSNRIASSGLQAGWNLAPSPGLKLVGIGAVQHVHGAIVSRLDLRERAGGGGKRRQAVPARAPSRVVDKAEDSESWFAQSPWRRTIGGLQTQAPWHFVGKSCFVPSFSPHGAVGLNKSHGLRRARHRPS
jgi:hypothetical protein